MLCSKLPPLVATADAAVSARPSAPAAAAATTPPPAPAIAREAGCLSVAIHTNTWSEAVASSSAFTSSPHRPSRASVATRAAAPCATKARCRNTWSCHTSAGIGWTKLPSERSPGRSAGAAAPASISQHGRSRALAVGGESAGSVVEEVAEAVRRLLRAEEAEVDGEVSIGMDDGVGVAHAAWLITVGLEVCAREVNE